MNAWSVPLGLFAAQVAVEFAVASLLTAAGVEFWPRVAICSMVGCIMAVAFYW